MKWLSYFSYLGLFILTIVVFKNWISSPILSAGDSWYYFPSMFDNHFFHPYAWYENSVTTGLGGQGFAFVTTFTVIAIVLQIATFFNLSWETVSRIFLYLPFIFLSSISSIFLLKKFFPNNPFWVFSPLIFTFNTYILMVVGGGQLPTALSYSLIPFSLFLFTKLLNDKAERSSSYVVILISSSLLFSVQCILDLRIAFVTGIAILIYIIVLFALNELRAKNLLVVFLSFIFIAFINSYWLISILLFGVDPIKQLGSAYSSTEMVKFLSFAKLENSVGLHHPYWYENIFGKIGFMRWEFLLLPIIAFSALLFRGTNKKENKYVLYFAILGILGIFLGKGASEPFGDIYIWLFAHIPGFQLFRDSFKWYSLVALSYSVLISFAVWRIYELIGNRDKIFKSKIFNLSNGFIVLTVLILLFLIRPALFNQLGGTFNFRDVPEEYQELNKFLSRDSEFYRTLWIPNTVLFGYYSNNHPQISGRDFFGEYIHEDLINVLGSSSAKKALEEASVKYVIVPSDTENEIYLRDRIYDDDKYQTVVTGLDSNPWFEKIEEFGKLVVYKTQENKGHFWCDCDAEIRYRFINPTLYELEIDNAKENDRIVFSEAFDDKWIAKGTNLEIKSSEFEKRLNSFVLPRDGDYKLKIYYSLQRYVDIGTIISVVSLVCLLVFLIYFLVKKLRK